MVENATALPVRLVVIHQARTGALSMIAFALTALGKDFFSPASQPLLLALFIFLSLFAWMTQRASWQVQQVTATPAGLQIGTAYRDLRASDLTSWTHDDKRALLHGAQAAPGKGSLAPAARKPSKSTAGLAAGGIVPAVAPSLRAGVSVAMARHAFAAGDDLLRGREPRGKRMECAAKPTQRLASVGLLRVSARADFA